MHEGSRRSPRYNRRRCPKTTHTATPPPRAAAVDAPRRDGHRRAGAAGRLALLPHPHQPRLAGDAGEKYLTRSAVGIATDIQNLLANNTQQLTKIAGSVRAHEAGVACRAPIRSSTRRRRGIDHRLHHARRRPPRTAHSQSRREGRRGQAGAARCGGAQELDLALQAALKGQVYTGTFQFVTAANQPAVIIAVPVVDDGANIGSRRSHRQPAPDQRSDSRRRQRRRDRVPRRPQRQSAAAQRAGGRSAASRFLESENRAGVFEGAGPPDHSVRRQRAAASA